MKQNDKSQSGSDTISETVKVFINNRLVPEATAFVSVFDHGLLYGDGIFETLRSYDGTVFKLRDHLRRLRRSAALIKLSLPYTTEAMASIIYRTLRANKLKNAYIRVTVTRGKGPIGLDISLCKDPSLIVITKPFSPYPASLYINGVRIIISGIRRNLSEAINPEIKSLNFLNNIIAKSEARKRRAFESVMLNHRGYVAEGTVSNIFMAKKNVLLTPSMESGILDGITRRTVLRIAGNRGIKIIEKKIRPAELYNADEVFLTNTTLEVMPVKQVDTVTFKKGIITTILMNAYKELVAKTLHGCSS